MWEEMDLNETEVVKAVTDWIKSDHPDWIVWGTSHFDVVAGPSKSEPIIAVECKGLPSQKHKLHKAIGQCLHYTTFIKVPCFIAIPENFIYKESILNTFEYHKLGIGLLSVNNNGHVTILRRAKE